jgi:hypothetical protein
VELLKAETLETLVNREAKLKMTQIR